MALGSPIEMFRLAFYLGYKPQAQKIPSTV